MCYSPHLICGITLFLQFGSINNSFSSVVNDYFISLWCSYAQFLCHNRITKALHAEQIHLDIRNKIVCIFVFLHTRIFLLYFLLQFVSYLFSPSTSIFSVTYKFCFIELFILYRIAPENATFGTANPIAVPNNCFMPTAYLLPVFFIRFSPAQARSLPAARLFCPHRVRRR